MKFNIIHKMYKTVTKFLTDIAKEIRERREKEYIEIELEEIKLEGMIPGLEVIVAKTSGEKYVSLYPVLKNGVDIIEYAAKTSIESAKTFFERDLQEYIEETEVVEMDIRKNKIKERIKKLEAMPDIIKELIEWYEKNLQAIEDAIEKTK